MKGKESTVERAQHSERVVTVIEQGLYYTSTSATSGPTTILDIAPKLTDTNTRLAVVRNTDVDLSHYNGRTKLAE